MKTILLFLAIAFCSCGPTANLTSKYGHVIPQNVTKITVSNVSFDKAVNVLLDSGFAMETIDKDYKTAKTEYKKVCPSCIPQICFYIREKDGSLIITGKWRSVGVTAESLVGLMSERNNKDAYVFDIRNEQDKVPRKCFQVMNDFAESLGSQITYSKQ